MGAADLSELPFETQNTKFVLAVVRYWSDADTTRIATLLLHHVHSGLQLPLDLSLHVGIFLSGMPNLGALCWIHIFDVLDFSYFDGFIEANSLLAIHSVFADAGSS